MSTPEPFVYLAYPGTGGHLGHFATVALEAEAAFRQVDSQLSARGLDLSKIVKMRLWYTGLQDFPDMNGVRDPLFRRTFPHESWPASSGFVTGGRGGATPRFEAEVIAHPEQHGHSTDAAIQQWGDVRPPYSHANTAGPLVFLSGQGGYLPGGTLVHAEPREQTIGALSALDGVLGAEGLTAADVVRMVVYTAPAATARLEDVAAEIDAHLHAHGISEHPPTSFIEAGELAFPGMIVEIEVMAVRDAAATPPITAHRRLAGGTPSGADGGVDAAADAVRVDSVVLATATAARASSTVAASAADLLAAAVERLDACRADLGSTPELGSLVTVWFSPPSERAAVTDAALALFPDTAALSVQPMPARQGVPRVVVELVSSVEA